MSGPINDDDLHAYVDGQLDPVQRLKVERRMNDDPGLRQRVQDYARQRDELRTFANSRIIGTLPASLDLDALVRNRLAQRRNSWRMAAAIGFAFAIGGVGGGFGGWWYGARPLTGIASLAEDGAASYAVFTTDKRRPVELWAAQREDLTRWVSNRLNRPVSPPDLSKLDYQLLGGRLVATAHGPAAMFMYENLHGTRVVLLVRPMDGERSLPLRQMEAGKIDGYAWVENGIGYSVVGGEPDEQLRALSQHLQQQLQTPG
jgi:anti-sigma factor RsiW